MSTPFYVSPQQAMADRAEYARKGIARGRSLVVLQYADGIVFVGENPSLSVEVTRITSNKTGRRQSSEARGPSGCSRRRWRIERAIPEDSSSVSRRKPSSVITVTIG